ncbi:ABC transporter ATP-binding protein [Sporosalibacterium faouarense]|uniref:ABC transporter ATP-binding protein n=1 Tax=Sporosalibacterium faouarense TaxID=516123 RepID=UPI00141D5591|nr:ABC transporter ATP-binding protein [Sporosalibacterium faouarense]MTI48767.1 ABC transporter ATP-binding protein [Bacillota bacterium]
MTKLCLEGIEKSYIKNNSSKNKSEDDFRIQIDELLINEGEFFGIVGPSGCGKTTLLKIVAGLQEINKGEVIIDGNNITKISAENRNISMVFQQPLLFPHMTVEENVTFGLKMKKIDKTERKKRAKQILESVGLNGYLYRYPSELSGGQKQRVAIARAIAYKPEVLLMDEPFSSLDPALREDMRNLILKLHSKYKMTTIFVTHDREDAFTLFDRMAIMRGGEILQIGSPKEIYENPLTKYIAGFMGYKNIFQGHINVNEFVGKNVKFKLPNQNYLKNKSIYGYIVIPSESLEVNLVEKNNQNIKKMHQIESKDYYAFLGILEEVNYNQGLLYLKIKYNSEEIFITQKNKFSEDLKIGQNILVEYMPEKIHFIEKKVRG